MKLSSLPVHVIRAIDRWGGFSARRGERVYARGATRLAASLHQRVESDAAAVAAGRGDLAVLDLGSGPGTLTVALANRLPTAKVIGIDPNPTMLGLAKRAGAPSNVFFALGAAERIPLPDSSIDLVVSTLSAHHWMDLVAALAEILRVLRPSGTARVYDVRFATFTGEELMAAASVLGLTRWELTRTVVGGPWSPFALIEVRPKGVRDPSPPAAAVA